MEINKVEIITFIIVFMIYSYIGASIEHIMYAIGEDKKTLENIIITGFPLYGIGAYIVIFVNKYLKIYTDNIIIHCIIYGLLLSFLEYIVGKFIVGAGPDSYRDDGSIKSWDYSNKPFNFQGIVTLMHLVSWGILGIFVSKLHPIIIDIVQNGIKNIIN